MVVMFFSLRHISQRPPEYGGTGTPLREGADHKAFVALAAKWKEMEADDPPPVVGSSQKPILDAPSPTLSPPKKGVWNWFNGKKKMSSTEAYLGEANKLCPFFLW